MTTEEQALVEEIYQLAEWHSDDDAEDTNQSPDDQTAHVNGLIRARCRKLLGETKPPGRDNERGPGER